MNMKKYVLAFFLCFISITPILAQRDHIDISNYILCINSGKDHIAYRLYLESSYTNVAVCDMLPPLKSQILKWGLLAQWLY